MRQIRDPMRNIVWAAWVERIDGEARAAIAVAEEVNRGRIYTAGTFLLVPQGVSRYEAIEQVREKLADEMRRRVHVSKARYYEHRFGMPLREYVRDLRR